MNAHLSSQQVAEWLAGERNVEPARHLAECAGCRANVDGVTQALSAFRESIHALSASRMRGEVQVRAAQKMGLPPALSWLTAVAVVVLAMVLLLPAHPVAVTDSTRGATALLQSVDAALSRPVPEPMEPLMKLFASEGGTEGWAASRSHNR